MTVLEAIVFLQKIVISPKIRRHPAFHQIQNIVVSNVQWINDILGVKKDFGYYQQSGDPDNEIVFRVVNKGEDLHSVVEETCLKMGEELQDLILVKEALVDLFGEDENLLRYFNVVDAFLDGQNQAYVENGRYQTSRGFVTLTRDDINLDAAG